MTNEKLIRLVDPTALLLLLSHPAPAQYLNWVHQSTGTRGRLLREVTHEISDRAFG